MENRKKKCKETAVAAQLSHTQTHTLVMYSPELQFLLLPSQVALGSGSVVGLSPKR